MPCDASGHTLGQLAVDARRPGDPGTGGPAEQPKGRAMSWAPDLYLRFQDERTRPAAELAARVAVADPRAVIDLGCGPGNSTAVLRARWPAAEVTGLDSDAAMLAAAAASNARVRWVRGDAASWEADGAFDVVYSNAMLQWLPDHAAVVPRLFRAVAPGGALALQIPVRMGSAIDRDVAAAIADPRWRDALVTAARALTDHDPLFYYDLLCARAARLDVWTTEYCHALDGPEAILAWVRGTRLRPFLAALPSDADRQEFEAALLERITLSHPRRGDGRVVFPFRRLFLVAYRGPT
jgi:trans-aconitate 2-methyltransferase